MKKRFRFDANYLAVAALAVFAVAPLLQPGYFWGAHDARHSVYFLFEFDQSIRDGVLYPRWAPDFAFGYGYPIFNIYSPMVYYIGEALHLLGMGFVEATKSVFALGFVFSGVAMYVLARDLLGRRAALLAAVIYMYVPYHLVDIYVRAAIAEFFALGFIPLVFWSFRKAAGAPLPRYIAAAGLSLAGLVMAHIAIAMLLLPFLAAYFLFLTLRSWPGARTWRGLWRAAWPLAASGALGAGLSAILWLPMTFEYAGVRTDQWTTAAYDFHSHFIYFFQFFAPFWGYGVSVEGPRDTMPFQVGVAPAVLALLSLREVVRLRRQNSKLAADVRFHQWLTLAALLLMLAAAAPLWDVLRLATFIQFPFRLLTIVMLTTSLLGATVIAHLRSGAEEAPQDAPWPLVGVLCALVVLGSYNYLTPRFIEPLEGPVSYAGLMRFQQNSGEMVGLTAWVKEKPTESPLLPLYLENKPITSKVDPASLAPGATAETIRHTTMLDEVRVTSPQGTWLRFYTFTYPGWRAYVDGKPVTIASEGVLGLMTVDVPAGEHVVRLAFEDTWPRTVGQALTALSLPALLGLVIWEVGLRRKSS